MPVPRAMQVCGLHPRSALSSPFSSPILQPRARGSPARRRRPTCCPALCGSRAASASDSPRCAPCIAVIRGKTSTPSDGRSFPGFRHLQGAPRRLAARGRDGRPGVARPHECREGATGSCRSDSEARKFRKRVSGRCAAQTRKAREGRLCRRSPPPGPLRKADGLEIRAERDPQPDDQGSRGGAGAGVRVGDRLAGSVPSASAPGARRRLPPAPSAGRPLRWSFQRFSAGQAHRSRAARP
jgi:hypothetical protein